MFADVGGQFFGVVDPFLADRTALRLFCVRIAVGDELPPRLKRPVANVARKRPIFRFQFVLRQHVLLQRRILTEGHVTRRTIKWLQTYKFLSIKMHFLNKLY